ncbi:hypothetical protein EUX98_g4101 [Antrodiella citrinella]|uniref:RlpA-like protein double-psi beta-barrel domain-containing protein n=1 Tax=Antrodiella citrinella TaxID=2447956 RepID=A0A4S4MXN1_9APHY|nr:hypothetical protein EUX98_g4101 [Antrodiella citrinella]
MFFSKTFFVATLALSASAMVTPHAARHVDHHAIAARLAAPQPIADASPAAVHVAPRKRVVKRCAAPSNSSSSVLSSSVAPTSALPTSSAAPAAVNNVGAEPPKVTTPSTTATPSSTPVQHSSTPDPPKATPTPSPTKVAASSPPPVATTKPVTTKAAATTAAPSPPPPATTAPSSGGGQVFSGDGTFYETGLGACGITNVDTDFIAAIGFAAFDSYPGYTGGNPNNNPICGKKVTAHYQGKQVTVAITDRCAGCEIATSLDFSPSAFDQLADPAVGRIHGVTWSYD